MSHAAVSCASSSSGGGDCGAAAITGGFTKVIAPQIELFAGADTFAQRVTGGLISSLVGGTVSEFSGGKFANGAIAAAYVYM